MLSKYKRELYRNGAQSQVRMRSDGPVHLLTPLLNETVRNRKDSGIIHAGLSGKRS
jgi:hypothetical protein